MSDLMCPACLNRNKFQPPVIYSPSLPFCSEHKNIYQSLPPKTYWNTDDEHYIVAQTMMCLDGDVTEDEL